MIALVPELDPRLRSASSKCKLYSFIVEIHELSNFFSFSKFERDAFILVVSLGTLLASLCGSTPYLRFTSSIFFSNKEPEFSIYDAFQCYAEDPYDTVAISGTMKKAVVKAEGYDNLFVLQSSRKLAQITALGLEAEALKDMIEIAHFDRYPLVIIDSGTVPVVVSMCITACDHLLIPMMMSQQCIGPTRNTINLAKRKHADILGLIPLTVGKSKWDRAILENWQEIISNTPELGWKLGLMEGIPQSKTIVKADLINGSIPAVALPSLEKIFANLNM